MSCLGWRSPLGAKNSPHAARSMGVESRSRSDISGLDSRTSIRRSRLNSNDSVRVVAYSELDESMPLCGTGLSTNELEVEAANLVAKGCSVRQLLRFYDFYADRLAIRSQTTTEDIVKDIVRPTIGKNGMSYIDSDFMQWFGGAQRAHRMVSHCRKARFVNTLLNIVLDASEWSAEAFVSSISERTSTPYYHDGVLNAKELLKDMTSEDLDKTYWLCLFANTQADPLDVEVLPYLFRKMNAVVISLDPDMQSLRSIEVITDIGEAVATTKICFRFALGFSRGVLETLRHGRRLMGSAVECESCGSGSVYDYLKGATHVLDGIQAYDELINCIIEFHFGRWTRLRELSGHGVAIMAGLAQLDMNFQWIDAMPTMQELFGDGSLFPQFTVLEHISVNFNHNRTLVSADELFDHLMLLPALTSLTFSSQGCTNLCSIDGLSRSLCRNTGFTLLNMDCQMCLGLSSLDDFGDGIAMLPALASLSLNFLGCVQIHCIDKLGKALGRLHALTSLSLIFGGCASLVTIDELGASLTALQSLASIHLDFHGCSKLASIDELSKGLVGLASLVSLTMNFECCRSLCSLGSLGGDLRRLHALKILSLNFNYCTNIDSIGGLINCCGSLCYLTSLKLLYHGCSKLCFVDGFPKDFAGLRELAYLFLNFGGTQVESIDDVCSSLCHLTGLTSLILDFASTNLTATDGLGKSLSELGNLTSLALDFSSSIQPLFLSSVDVHLPPVGLTCMDDLGVSLARLDKLTTLNLRLDGNNAIILIDSLGEALTKLRCLSELSLAIRGCERLICADRLGKGLAGLEALRLLSLGFGFCGQLTSVGELCTGFGELHHLSFLDMDFRCCKNLASINEVSTALARLLDLTSLTLNVENCDGLKSIDCLGEGLANLPTHRLTSLDLDVSSCRNLDSIESFSSSLAELQVLNSLRLVLHGCDCLTTIDELGNGLAKLLALRSLSLHLGGSYLTSISQVCKGLRNLRSLVALQFSLSQCNALTSIDELGQSLVMLTSLTKLHLNINACNGLDSIDEFCKGLAKLQVLEFKFKIEGCAQLLRMLRASEFKTRDELLRAWELREHVLHAQALKESENALEEAQSETQSLKEHVVLLETRLYVTESLRKEKELIQTSVQKLHEKQMLRMSSRNESLLDEAIKRFSAESELLNDLDPDNRLSSSAATSFAQTMEEDLIATLKSYMMQEHNSTSGMISSMSSSDIEAFVAKNLKHEVATNFALLTPLLQDGQTSVPLPLHSPLEKKKRSDTPEFGPCMQQQNPETCVLSPNSSHESLRREQEAVSQLPTASLSLQRRPLPCTAPSTCSRQQRPRVAQTSL